MKVKLTSAERTHMLKRHRSETNRKIGDRMKAVLLSDDGLTHRDIARVLFIDEETVARHISDYLKEDKLKNASGGSNPKLSDDQSAKLIRHLESNTYMDAKVIVNYVHEQFGITYSHSGMVAWLHQNGFSYKHPAKRPAKCDRVKQAEFIKEYEALKDSMTEESILLFGDGVHPSMQTKVSCGWIKTGENKSIESTASRTRVNIFGAVNLADLALTYSSYKTINSESMTDFLEQLNRTYPNKAIHLILDQGAYNKSMATLSKAKSLNITIHHLPPYSPNLNPVERIWKVMNEKVRNNVYFKSAKDFKESILRFFETTWESIKDTLKSRVNDNFQRL